MLCEMHVTTCPLSRGGGRLLSDFASCTLTVIAEILFFCMFASAPPYQFYIRCMFLCGRQSGRETVTPHLYAHSVSFSMLALQENDPIALNQNILTNVFILFIVFWFVLVVFDWKVL